MNARRNVLIAVIAAATLTLTVLPANASAAYEFETLEAVTHGSEEADLLTPSTLSATEVAGEAAKMTVGGATVSCSTATATASLATGHSSTLSLAPSFSGCKASGLFPAEIKPGACTIAVHSLEETEAGKFGAQADVACPAGGEILIKTKNLGGTKTTCLIHVYPQTNRKGIKVTNMTEASPEDFTVKSEVETMEAVVTKGEEACPITTGTYTNAKYTANTTVTAHSTGEGVPPIKARGGKVQSFHFAMEEEEENITGNNLTSIEFTFASGKVVCANSLWSQELSIPAKEFDRFSTEAHPEACKHEKEEVEFRLGTCTWSIFAGTISDGGAFLGRFSPACVMGEFASVKLFGCTIRIGPQLGEKRWIEYENAGTLKTREVKADLNVWDVEYEEEGGGCKNPGKTRDDGKIEGKLRFQGINTGQNEQLGVWVATDP